MSEMFRPATGAAIARARQHSVGDLLHRTARRYPDKLAVVGVGSWLALFYAWALGVAVDDRAGLLRLRLVPYAVLLVLFLGGAARVAPPGGFLGGFVRGAAFGGAAALLVLLWTGLRARRRERRRG